MNLAVHFVVCGYIEGNGVFYVALENNDEKKLMLPIVSLIHEVRIGCGQMMHLKNITN